MVKLFDLLHKLIITVLICTLANQTINPVWAESSSPVVTPITKKLTELNSIIEKLSKVYKSTHKFNEAVIKYGTSTIDKFVDRIVAPHNYLKPVDLKKNQKMFQICLKEARTYKKELEQVLLDPALSVEKRLDLILFYIQNIFIPFKGLTTLMHLKKSYLIKSLRLTFPETIAPEGSQNEAIIAIGKNPAKPLGIEVRTHKRKHKQNLRYIRFNPLMTMLRDVNTLVDAPSRDNYMLAAKLLTIHTMLKRARTYHIILGKDELFEVPPACRLKNNIFLPKKIKFATPEKDVITEKLDQLLMFNGFIAGTQAYKNYYMNNVSANPERGGFSAIRPFQEIISAQYGLDKKADENDPEFDDHLHFQLIADIKLAKSINFLQQKPLLPKLMRRIEKSDFLKKRAKKIINERLERFLPIVELYQAESKTGTNSNQNINFDTEGFSKYIVKKMLDAGTNDWTKIVPQKIIKKLRKKISIDMPGNYAPDSWRRWGLKTLKNGISNAAESNNFGVINVIFRSCHKHDHQICFNPSKPMLPATREQIVKNYLIFLSEIDNSSDFLPKLIINENSINSLLPSMKSIWNSLSVRNLLENKISEWDYIKSQIDDDYNPWASLRLGYLIESTKKEKSTRENKMFHQAAKIFGLTTPLTPMWGSKILSKEEKKLVWLKIIDNFNTKNIALFQGTPENGDLSYIEIFESINSQNIFNRKTAEKIISDLEIGQTDTVLMEKGLDNADNSVELKMKQMLLEIYNSKDDTEKQLQLASAMMEKEYIKSDDSSKIAFLELDNAYKTPIYRQLLRDSAANHLKKVTRSMQELCVTNLDNIDSFKEQYHMTSRARQELSKLLEQNSDPKSVMDTMTKWSRHEWQNVAWGGGSGILFMAGIIIGAGCTLVTGPLCLPAIQILGSALMAASVATQTIATAVSYHQYSSLKKRSHRIEKMAHLGLTDLQEADKIKIGLWQTAIDAAFIIPMLGYAWRSTKIGSQIISKAIHGTYAGVSKGERKLITKTIIKQIDIQKSKYLLGMKSLKSSKQSVLKSIKNNLPETVLVAESKGEINKFFAKAASKIFDNNPARLIKHLEHYKNKATKSILKMTNIEQRPNRYNRIFGKKIMQFRKNRMKKYIDANTPVNEMLKELKQIKKSGQSLDQFFKNDKTIEKFSDLIMSVPMRLRELPHMFFIMGSPEIAARNGIRIPYLKRITNGSHVRRLLIARENLLYESIKRNAFKQFGLMESSTMYNNFDLYQRFRSTVKNAGLSKKLENYEEKLVTNIFNYYKKNPGKKNILPSNRRELRQLLFNNCAMKKDVDARIIFNQIPFEELHNLEELPKISYKALEKLKSYKNVDEFDSYLSILKIISIHRETTSLIQ